MTAIVGEMLGFLTAIISGMVVKLGYQTLCCVRDIWKHNYFLIGIEDLLFWIGTAMYLFVQIYHTNNGSVRWGFILGVVVGVWIASVILKKVKKTVEKIYNLHLVKNIAKNKEKRYYN